MAKIAYAFLTAVLADIMRRYWQPSFTRSKFMVLNASSDV